MIILTHALFCYWSASTLSVDWYFFFTYNLEGWISSSVIRIATHVCYYMCVTSSQLHETRLVVSPRNLPMNLYVLSWLVQTTVEAVIAMASWTIITTFLNANNCWRSTTGDIRCIRRGGPGHNVYINTVMRLWSTIVFNCRKSFRVSARHWHRRWSRALI